MSSVSGLNGLNGLNVGTLNVAGLNNNSVNPIAVTPGVASSVGMPSASAIGTPAVSVGFQQPTALDIAVNNMQLQHHVQQQQQQQQGSNVFQSGSKNGAGLGVNRSGALPNSTSASTVAARNAFQTNSKAMSSSVSVAGSVSAADAASESTMFTKSTMVTQGSKELQ